MHKHSNKFMIGAIVGGTIGALTTLLFKTQEGKKIQKKLMKKFDEMNEKSGHFGIDSMLGHSPLKKMLGNKKNLLSHAKRKIKSKLKGKS